MNDRRNLWTADLAAGGRCCVNVALVLSFWSSFGGEDALAFRAWRRAAVH